MFDIQKKNFEKFNFCAFSKKYIYIKQKQKEIENNKQIQEMVQKLSFANQSILQHYGIHLFFLDFEILLFQYFLKKITKRKTSR